MPDEISIDDLLRMQAEMSSLASQMIGERDPAKIQVVTTRLQQQSGELQRLARAFEKQELAKQGTQRRSVEVKLSEEQQKRVESETGIRLESVWLQEEIRAEGGAEAPSPDPELVEKQALAEAYRRKNAAEAEASLLATARQVLAQIESSSPAAAAKLAELKADPNFLGGLLSKK